jgi:hypothetical protein
MAVKPKSALAFVALVVAAIPGGAAAGDPWLLRCPSMPSEQPVPAALRPAVHAFFPWVPAPKGLRARPVYLMALSSRTAISRDGDDTDSAGYYLHRALIAVAPSQSGTVVVRGHRLGRAGHRTVLGFSTNGGTRCTVHTPYVSCGWRPLRFASALRIAPRTGWRIVATELRIGRTGCFQITVTGTGLRETIPLAVPGPDYGTPGW